MGPKAHQVLAKQQAKQQGQWPMEVKVEPPKAPGGPPVPGSTIAATARPVLLVPRAARAPAPGVPKAGGSPAPGDTNFGPEINARAQPAWQRPPDRAFLGGRSRVTEIHIVSYGHTEDALKIPANWWIFNVEHLRDPSSSDYFHICFKICLFLFSIYLVLILSLKILQGWLSAHDGRHWEIQDRLIAKRWPCLEVLQKVRRYLDGHKSSVARIAFECKSGRHRSVVCAWMAEVACRPDLKMLVSGNPKPA